MPVQLPTTYGKTDYNVVTALKRLASALDQLESTAGADRHTADIHTIRQELAALTKRVDVLNRQVNP